MLLFLNRKCKLLPKCSERSTYPLNFCMCHWLFYKSSILHTPNTHSKTPYVFFGMRVHYHQRASLVSFMCMQAKVFPLICTINSYVFLVHDVEDPLQKLVKSSCACLLCFVEENVHENLTYSSVHSLVLSSLGVCYLFKILSPLISCACTLLSTYFPCSSTINSPPHPAPCNSIPVFFHEVSPSCVHILC